jgi:hypothetical protein
MEVRFNKGPTSQLFDKDREVKHASAIGLQESVDLIGVIWLLTQVRELLFEAWRRAGPRRNT